MTSSSSSKCGLAPSEITLKRGERQSLVFWSDQKYEHVEHEHEDILVETTTKDYFLEAVNGGIDDQDAVSKIFNKSTMAGSTKAYVKLRGNRGTDPPRDWCWGLLPPPLRPTEIGENLEINA